MASKADISAGRAFVRLYLKNDMSAQLTRGLKASSAKLRKFGRSAMMMGRQIAIAGAVMTAPFVLATRTFAQFDDAMREVGAVTQATGAAFDALTDKAKKLGATTSFTAVQVALLMAELGRAGFVPDQIDQMTGAVLSLARATKTEGAEAAGIMATAIRQFGLEAKDASRVADVLTTGANKSFNTLESLGESLKFAGPVARDFNMSLEDTVAVLGTLGNVGIKGTMAGTTMRRILLATGAEAEKLKRIFGVEFLDAAGNARPLVDTLQDIADATRNLGTGERAAKFKEAFGLRGITGASAIGRNITGTRELRDAIAEAGGVAAKTAAEMDAGLGGAFRILKSAVEGVQIAIGEALSPTLMKLSKFITEAARSSIKWVESNKGMVVAAAKAAAVVTALGATLILLGATSWAIGAGIAAAVASVQALGVALTFLAAHPAILTLSVVAALVIALDRALHNANKRTAELSDGMSKLRQAGDELRATDTALLDRLDDLTSVHKLTTREMNEAETIIKTLSQRYGDLGVSVDTATGKLTKLTDAQKTATKEQMKADAQAALRREIGEKQMNLGEMTEELKSLGKTPLSPVRNVIDWLTGQTKGRVAELSEQAKAELDALDLLYDRLRKLRSGDKGAVTGGATAAGGGEEAALATDEAVAFRERKLREIEALRIAAINDQHTRQLAVENALHEREKRLAEELGGTEKGLEDTRHARAMANIEAEHNLRKRNARDDDFDAFLQTGADAQARKKAVEEDISSQIARLTIETGGGTEQEKRQQILNMEHMQALQDAASQGVGFQGQERINELFDLKRQQARQEASSASVAPRLTATFSAAAARISGFQPGGGPEKRMADGIASIAKSNDEIVRQNERAEARWRIP